MHGSALKTHPAPKFFSGALLRHSSWFIGLFQAGLISGSLTVAWLLRFDFSLSEPLLLLKVIPLLILLRLSFLAPFGLFHGWWRYTALTDLFDILKGVGAGSIAFFIVLRILLRVTEFPRSIYVLESVLTLTLLAGVRFISRAVFDSINQDVRSAKRVAIIGAGAAAHMIVRELRKASCGYLAVACVDDDPSKKGLKVHGVPVMGAVSELPRIILKHPVDEILIAIPSASATQMQGFLAVCEAAGARVRTAPSLMELIAGHLPVNAIRDVNLEDLLGRQPARIDLETVRAKIQNRSVLVTGAAGSIGSELCRQILACHPGRLFCADQSETGMFYLHRELEKAGVHKIAHFCVTDVSDAEEMFRLFRSERPDVVFHAAAHKHVSLMQMNARKAIRNNIFGLLGLLDAAEQNRCESFVFISSDKAVNPANIMGATKRVGELILSSRPAGSMRCISVRFGNVLGSHGSVVPIFQEQIRRGSELTITNPDVCRFFMTIHEAVSLVLQAFTIGKHGEILVLDMDRPVRILDLARALIRLSGKSADEIPIRFTGLQPGEKLFEELFYRDEPVRATQHPQIRAALARAGNWSLLQQQLRNLRQSIALDEYDTVCSKLYSIVSTHPHQNAAKATLTSAKPAEPEPLHSVAHA